MLGHDNKKQPGIKAKIRLEREQCWGDRSAEFAQKGLMHDTFAVQSSYLFNIGEKANESERS